MLLVRDIFPGLKLPQFHSYEESLTAWHLSPFPARFPFYSLWPGLSGISRRVTNRWRTTWFAKSWWVTNPDQKSSDFRIVQGRIKWITDCTSGFTAIRNENWKKLNLISDGYQIETEMIFEQAKNGFTIAETPVSCNWETGTSKLSITKDGSKTLLLLAEKLIHYSTNGTKPEVKNS